MKHFDIHEWSDFARGLGDEASRQAMTDHLASGCARCDAALSAVQRVVTLAQNELDWQPPVHAVRSVKAFFALNLPERAPKLKSLALQLAFDSFMEPAPAGIRSLDTTSRHLVYYAQNYALDLRLDYEPQSHALHLGGEILDRQFGPVANIPAFLFADDQVVSRSTSGELGQFDLHCEQEGKLRLCLVMNDDESIDISLDSRRRRPANAPAH